MCERTRAATSALNFKIADLCFSQTQIDIFISNTKCKCGKQKQEAANELLLF